MTNKLFYGDNLDVLRNTGHFPDASVDLIYLDPPFNSNATYNMLFRSPSGEVPDSQIEAFSDTWQWGHRAAQAYDETLTSGRTDIAELLRAMKQFLGENAMMAYLSMMAIRLIELKRVLKPSGSLYLHCDPTASHYLKLLLDGVFGPGNFLNEIIWRRTGSHSPRRSFGPVHDTILAYTNGPQYHFNVVRRPYMRGHVESRYGMGSDGKMRFTSGGNVLTGAGATAGSSGRVWRGFDPTSKNRHWAIPGFYEELMPDDYRTLEPHEKLEALYQAGLIEIKEGSAWPIMVRHLGERDGTPLTDIWAYQPYTHGTVWETNEGIDEDVMWLGPTDPERLSYPTQKPVGLLERIIEASSNEGDIVLDPFCGCGTTVHAAEKLRRQWIGIDITHLAVGLIEKRLQAAFPAVQYQVFGKPADKASAERLATDEPHQFQNWVSFEIGGAPWKGGKKGADRGVDGHIYFRPDGKNLVPAIISVKAGRNVGVGMVRDLRGVVERENAAAGVFICVVNPSRAMETEAAAAGTFKGADGRTYPKIQIYTLAELFMGMPVKLPYIDPTAAFRRARREETAQQRELI